MSCKYSKRRFKEKSASVLHKSYCVCDTHFENIMFANDHKTRLQNHAIPTILCNSQNNSNIITLNDQLIGANSISSPTIVNANTHTDNLASPSQFIAILLLSSSYSGFHRSHGKSVSTISSLGSEKRDASIQVSATLSSRTLRKALLK
jgi:hypothetical protein